MKTIIEAVTSTPTLATFASTIDNAGLTETLSGDGPLTVFAPTDEAFAKVPIETLAALLADTAKLKTALSYHVIQGRMTAQKLSTTTKLTTTEGSSVEVTSIDNGIAINGAHVVNADIECTNGVVHTIDTVLMP